MSNANEPKLVKDFESGASQPDHNFSAVYQDLREIQADAPNMQAFSQELIAANKALLSAGAIPESVYPGYPDFVILGADSEGHIITIDPTGHEVDIRNQNMQIVSTEMEPYADPFKPGDFCTNPQQPSDQGSPATPTDSNGGSPTESSQPHSEQWGGRTFDVQPDGSSHYTVVSGDTVWAVAQSWLEGNGDPNPSNAQIEQETNAISQASELSDPNLIYPGNMLTIPAKNGDVTPTAAQPAAPAQPADNPASAQPTYATPPPSANPPVEGSALQQLEAIGLNPNNSTDKVVEMMSGMEGGPQSVNWDDSGEGISVGLYQANQHGDLPGLLQAMNQADPNDFNAIFGSYASQLLDPNQVGSLTFTQSNQLGQDLQRALTLPQFQKVELDRARSRVDQFAQAAAQDYGVTSEEGVALFSEMSNWGPAIADKYFQAASGVNGQDAKLQAILQAAQNAGDSQAVAKIQTIESNAQQAGLNDTTTFAA